MLAIARAAELQVDLEPMMPRPEVARLEMDDIRAALDWAVEAEPVLAGELLTALGTYWVAQAPEEGLARTRALLALGDVIPPALRAELLTLEGGVTILAQGSQAAGEPSYHAAIALHRELGDTRGEARVVTRLAVHAGTQGKAAEARALLERVRVLTEGEEFPALEAQRLSTLATIALAGGDHESALTLYRASADVAAGCGFTLWETWCRSDLAEVALDLGRIDVAASEARTALTKAWEHRDRRITCSCLIVLARVALAQGDAARAGRLWGATAAELDETGVLARSPDLDRLAEPLRSAEGRGFAAGVESGRTEPLDVAVAVALGQTEP
jgi:hypothetical protein